MWRLKWHFLQRALSALDYEYALDTLCFLRANELTVELDCMPCSGVGCECDVHVPLSTMTVREEQTVEQSVL